MKINFFQVKTLFTLCLELSQSKDILSHLNSTVYTCYSSVWLRKGLFFVIVSVVYTSLRKIPIIIHCLAHLGIFGRLFKNVYFRLNFCLQFVSFCHSLWRYFLIQYCCQQLLQLCQTYTGSFFILLSLYTA